MNITEPKFNYFQFINWIENILESNENNLYPPEKFDFLELNFKRMQRINKTLVLNENLLSVLKKIAFKQTWYVITEPWCGDSAQILPILAKISESSLDKIKLEILLRDQNPELIAKYHTNGSHAIPKIVALDDEGNELFVWGPRPSKAQDIFKQWKANPGGKSWHDFEVQLHTWYAIDKTLTTQQELYEILSDFTTQIDPFADFNFQLN